MAGEGERYALLADDEEIVRKVGARMLERLGFQVCAVDNGELALSRFREAPERYHLAMLDLSMPLMDGLACMSAMRTVRPALPVILASGHDAQRTTDTVPLQHTKFIQKPFRFAALSEAVAELLD